MNITYTLIATFHFVHSLPPLNLILPCFDEFLQVNCPFYFKIGACRHADRCSRLHHRPAFSQTILIKHVYRHPVREAELKALSEGLDKDSAEFNKEEAQEDFLQFFE